MLVTIFLHILGMSCTFLYFTTTEVNYLHFDAYNRMAKLVIFVGFESDNCETNEI